MSASSYQYTAGSGVVYQVILMDDFAIALGLTPATGVEPYLDGLISPRFINYRSAILRVSRSAVVGTLSQFQTAPQHVTVAGVDYDMVGAYGETVAAYLRNAPIQALNLVGGKGDKGDKGDPGSGQTVYSTAHQELAPMSLVQNEEYVVALGSPPGFASLLYLYTCFFNYGSDEGRVQAQIYSSADSYKTQQELWLQGGRGATSTLLYQPQSSGAVSIFVRYKSSGSDIRIVGTTQDFSGSPGAYAYVYPLELP
jgi:hypothetical protein